MAAMQAPDSTVKYVKLFAEYNKRYGAETYLFNTWEQALDTRPTIDLFTSDGSRSIGV